MVNLEEYIRNRNQFPHEELAKYVGQHVAWSPDGTKILASDVDPLKVLAAIKALGYDPADTPIEDIPVEDTFLGAGFLFAGNEEASE